MRTTGCASWWRTCRWTISVAVGDQKKRLELVALKAAIEQMQEEYAFSERRACGLVRVAVATYRYRSSPRDDELRRKLVELAREKPRYGYRRLHVLLRRSGEVVNHKRVHRVYREAGLCIRRKKRKHCGRAGTPLRICTAANQEWALDCPVPVISIFKSNEEHLEGVVAEVDLFSPADLLDNVRTTLERK